MGSPCILFQFPAQLYPAHFRHHDITHHQVWMLAQCLLPSFLTILCFYDLVGFTEIILQIKAEIFVVLRQQNTELLSIDLMPCLQFIFNSTIPIFSNCMSVPLLYSPMSIPVFTTC